MKIAARFHLVAFNFWLLLQQVTALLTLPTEDLLGPEVCPTGSFCTETSDCTSAYYTTKFGLPFYCGPHEKIDSKVCCIETESTTTKPHIHLDLEQNELNNGVPPLNLSHLNSTDDDDEVEILSLPFLSNHVEEVHPFDAESILLEPDAGLERPIGDVEALLENVIEQDYNSDQPSPSHNVRETGFRPVDAQQNMHNNFEHSNRVDEPIEEMHDMVIQSPRTGSSIPDYEQNEDIEFRAHPSYENQKQRAFTCPCEKGEKGDPGPKGETGEPGKIIYIPVFVNTAGVPHGAAFNTAPAGAHVQFASQQASLNQPPHGQIPQHPNPTIVPFNVPINIPTPQPQQQQMSVPQVQVVQQHQPPPSLYPTPINSIPYTDDMQARLSRHTQQMQDQQRFANRRY